MSKDEKDIKFEEALENLEKIANELENGNLTLDEAVSKFEEGMELSKKCNSMLNEAEKKITILTNNGEENFTPEE